MSVQQIRTFLAAPNWETSNSRTTDYLNQKVPSLESLDQLEALLEQTQIRHEDLQTRLTSCNERTRTLITDTRNSAEEQLTTSKELSLQRHSLADELSELTNELVSVLYDENKQPTLLEDIETLHRDLKELESVKGYVQVIQYGLKLSESAVAQAKSANIVSVSSVTVYQDLRKFVEKITNACVHVEDGSGQQKLHIVDFLERVRDCTWADIKNALSTTLTTAAEKLGWPMNVNYAAASTSDRKAFEDAFVNLLKLQAIGKDIGVDTTEKSGLYSLQALVIPVSLRFKYHFEGTRPTNRLDKVDFISWKTKFVSLTLLQPEWYFTHVLNVAHEHRHFMESIIQPLLSSSEYTQIHAWREFALLLLPLLSRKFRKTIPFLLPSPSVLAHTIYQALSFDASFTEEGFQLQGTSAASLGDKEVKWDGISHIILGNQQWFQAWLAGEQKFVEDQYLEIIGASDAWAISDETEGAQATALKSTNSARRIKALFEQVTDRYSPLPSASQRIQFLISVQLPILDSYLSRITSSLDAFETLSLALVRAVPGALSLGGKGEGSVNVNTQNLTSGIEGIQRLCKALLSAAHVELALEAWAEDLFFLELWSNIHHNAALRARIEANPLLPQLGPENLEVPKDTIFEVFINRYTAIIIRAENMIVQQVCNEVETQLKAHFATYPNPSSPDSSMSPESPLISQTLLAPLTLLSTHLTYLLSTLSQTSFTALYRRISTGLSEHILHRQILFRGSFEANEGRIILAECELFVETCQGVLINGGGFPGGRARVEAPWAKLLQAGRLVGLEGDVWEKVVDTTFGVASQEEWDELMRTVTGYSELSRESVGNILRRRDDCLA
ncbi:RAD50-interacting protein 1 [Leucoagaricus sp. SymC.cos]|nr:RAD50-interacting protein 1 [Leucoagaricus sp. SymC.cos]